MSVNDEQFAILEILEREPVRYVDGRYRDGFVDQGDLDDLVGEELAEKYASKSGVTFVRLTDKGREALSK